MNKAIALFICGVALAFGVGWAWPMPQPWEDSADYQRQQEQQIVQQPPAQIAAWQAQKRLTAWHRAITEYILWSALGLAAILSACVLIDLYRHRLGDLDQP